MASISAVIPLHYTRRLFYLVLSFILVAGLAVPAAGALGPDELVLIVNANIPVSVKTAEFYAKARLVPDGRIIALNLPASEEISFDKYEQDVVPVVRDFLHKNGLDQKVRCAVTFFGVPLRIGSKQLSPAEIAEVAEVRKELAAIVQKAMPLVVEAETMARELDPSFTPRVGEDAGDLPNRANHALSAITSHIPREESPAQKAALQRLFNLLRGFGGDAEIAQRLTDTEMNPLLPPDEAKNWPARRAAIAAAKKEIEALNDRRFDPEARKKLRSLVASDFGPFGSLNAMQAQIEYLSTDGTLSAFDSELALVWWKYYSRAKWQGNPLNWRSTGEHPPVVMVMRLDGPQEETAMQIILASLKAERAGLSGRVVIDSTGGMAPDGTPDRKGVYREFDQKLLNLAEVIRVHTKLPLTLDKRPPALAAHSVKDVALYCGWYSVRNYIPACTFVPGAVGFHIASFELVSLRTDNEKGWCAGLLNDGIAATCGAVAEPYLSAFPAPDEFFPLLLTGKLTLAEVYWKTVPMTSWMISCIGDPLYTPFKVNPQLKVEDLPSPLKRACEVPPAPAARQPMVETPPPQL